MRRVLLVDAPHGFALDLPEHYFDSSVDRSISRLRVRNYPAPEVPPDADPHAAIRPAASKAATPTAPRLGMRGPMLMLGLIVMAPPGDRWS